MEAKVVHAGILARANVRKRISGGASDFEKIENFA